jgi:predicted porin
MNYKIFLGAILVGVAGVAAAQSQVSIYGILDAGLALGSGGPGGSSVDVASGVSAVSRLGFKGSEDLGGGWSARFVLESALALDTGATDKDNLLFGRQAWVSLASEQLGEIAVGRQYTPGYRTLRAADPFANNYGGAADRLMKAEVGGVRTPNTITYTTPALGGMDAQLSYAAGEVAGDSRKARQLGASIGYQAGKLSMRIAHQQANNATATDGADSTLYTLKYDFGAAIASVGYGTNHGLQDARDHDLLIGLTIPVERHKLMLSYIRKDDDARTTDFSASQVALAYNYFLSKHTLVYAAYARLSNINFTTTKFGNGPRELDLGLRQSF